MKFTLFYLNLSYYRYILINKFFFFYTKSLCYVLFDLSLGLFVWYVKIPLVCDIIDV